jgi:uncharacterized protein (TIGR02001 family)
MRKSLLTASLLLTSALGAPLAANASDFTYSSNVGLVTDYVFRGITQSDENFAIQGGYDVGHSSGFYAGVWASSVDFNDGDEANIETDLYAGYSNEFKGLNYDIGLIYYGYPGANSNLNYDFWEGSLALGYDFGAFAASTSVNYSPEYFGESGDATYVAAAVDVPTAYDVTLSAHVGRQTIDENGVFGVPDYTDWSLGLGYTLGDFDLSLQYIDTNLDEPTECADGCSERVVFGIFRSF